MGFLNLSFAGVSGWMHPEMSEVGHGDITSLPTYTKCGGAICTGVQIVVKRQGLMGPEIKLFHMPARKKDREKAGKRGSFGYFGSPHVPASRIESRALFLT